MARPQDAKKVASDISSASISVEAAQRLMLDKCMPGEVSMEALWLVT